MQTITNIRLATATALAAAALACGIGAADASAAKAPPGQKLATFEATISGTQVTTWHYEDPVDPNDRCDTGVKADGDQTIRFSTERFQLMAATPPKKRPDLFQTKGRPQLLTIGGFPDVALEAERNGDEKFTPAIGNDCGDNGGPDRETEPLPPDCGERKGKAYADTYYFTPPWEGEVVVPARPDRDWLKLSIRPLGWGGDEATTLDELYQRCPMRLEGDAGHAEFTGDVITTAVRSPESRLFDARRKKLTISGSAIRNYTTLRSTGQTIVAWNLRLKRVKD